MLPGLMNRSGKLHALLSTARVANIPSVVSNVWVGVAIGAAFVTSSTHPLVPWSTALSLVAAGVALYVAGNFLNDWADREWDAVRRPERALPRGVFSAPVYLVTAIILGTLGVLLAATVGRDSALTAAGIAACVCLYTYSHKRTPWSVIPMGLCRALLPMMGMVGVMGFSPKPDFSPLLVGGSAAGGLFCYIMGLSLSARYESMPVAPKGATLLSKSLLVIAAIIMSCPLHWISEMTALWGRFLPYGMWLLLCVTLYRKSLPAYVSGLLAGIPLLDWILMLPILAGMNSSEYGWNPFSIACFAIPPLAFVSALLLQRLAPAT
jgi:4-hydroxybenzoate polyprenyltransferase